MTKKKMKDVGRPTVMDKDTIYKLEEAFSMGCSDGEACLHAGIGKSTLYKYQTENPEFIERKELLKEHTIKLARQTVIKALESNADIALKYLERKKKDEFSTRQESTGKDGGSMELKVIKIGQDNIL